MKHNIEGYATPEGTTRFAQRFVLKGSGKIRPDFYTMAEGLTLSSLGIGTYLGQATDQEDENVFKAVIAAVENGINVIDTSSNYRFQRAERVVGRAIKHLIDSGKIKRDEIFVSTKGGFIPFDTKLPSDPDAYLRDRFLKAKILDVKDVVAGCHSLSESFLRDQFEQSRANLGLETIDLYFLHNPETQLDEVNRDTLYHRLHRAFVFLEEKIKAGLLRTYGVATWSCFRVPPTSRESLFLDRIIDTAKDHGDGHGFRFIQLPLNLAMQEATSEKTQQGKTILEKARELKINVFTSASIMQGRILGRLPPEVNGLAPNQPDSVKALNYTRSQLGVNVALCGMKSLEHVKENLKLAEVARM